MSCESDKECTCGCTKPASGFFQYLCAAGHYTEETYEEAATSCGPLPACECTICEAPIVLYKEVALDDTTRDYWTLDYLGNDDQGFPIYRMYTENSEEDTDTTQESIDDQLDQLLSALNSRVDQGLADLQKLHPVDQATHAMPSTTPPSGGGFGSVIDDRLGPVEDDIHDLWDAIVTLQDNVWSLNSNLERLQAKLDSAEDMLYDLHQQVESSLDTVGTIPAEDRAEVDEINDALLGLDEVLFYSREKQQHVEHCPGCVQAEYSFETDEDLDDEAREVERAIGLAIGDDPSREDLATTELNFPICCRDGSEWTSYHSYARPAVKPHSLRQRLQETVFDAADWLVNTMMDVLNRENK